jgi:hypothetical protein
MRGPQYFEPVVVLGRALQVSLGLAAFWQAERLAYWQFSAPPAPLMQNLPLPVACTELLPIVLLLSIDEPCALAMEMPAINAATAVNAVNVFMVAPP